MCKIENESGASDTGARLDSQKPNSKLFAVDRFPAGLLNIFCDKQPGHLRASVLRALSGGMPELQEHPTIKRAYVE